MKQTKIKKVKLPYLYSALMCVWSFSKKEFNLSTNSWKLANKYI